MEMLEVIEDAAKVLGDGCAPRINSRLRRAKTEKDPLTDVSRFIGVTDIKTAFRKRAKLAHPDTLRPKKEFIKEQIEFSEVLQAYQVLTNARERQVYDLLLDKRTGAFLKGSFSAAEHQSPFTNRAFCVLSVSTPNKDISYRKTSATRANHFNQEDTTSWIREGTWAEWAASCPAPRQNSNRLQRYKDNLQVEFRQAMRHAYLGPELSLGEQELPECFEADERSESDAQDILQLVSGRSVLGSVRIKTQRLLNGEQGNSKVKIDRDHQVRLASELNCKEEKPADDKVKPHICSSYPENVGPSDQPHNLRKDADSQIVLEMKVNDDVIAYAVKLKSKKEDPKVETNFFDRHGQIVARERNGRILKAKRHGSLDQDSPSTERTFYDCHQILKGTTPLVRHVYFVGYQGKDKIKLCKLRRAWLPPSKLWVFPPRSQQHQGRSWYFEWIGYRSSSHPLWLPPYIFVLTAAFESLEDEENQEKHLTYGKLYHRAKQWLSDRIGLSNVSSRA